MFHVNILNVIHLAMSFKSRNGEAMTNERRSFEGDVGACYHGTTMLLKFENVLDVINNNYVCFIPICLTCFIPIMPFQEGGQLRAGY